MPHFFSSESWGTQQWYNWVFTNGQMGGGMITHSYATGSQAPPKFCELYFYYIYYYSPSKTPDSSLGIQSHFKDTPPPLNGMSGSATENPHQKNPSFYRKISGGQILLIYINKPPQRSIRGRGGLRSYIIARIFGIRHCICM